MNTNKELLLTGCFPYSEEQLAEIRRLGYNITFIQNELEEIKEDVSNFEYVVCNGLFLHNSVERFTNLKFVQSTSAGMERLPISYFNQWGIKYCNAKNVYSVPIAEWVVMYLLNIYKSMNQFYEQKISKKWIKNRNLEELTNKNVTIIGFGSIGKEIAKRLKPFGVHINAADIYKINDPLIDQMFFLEDINQALLNTDVVILSIALTDDTYHLLNNERLSLMKKDAVLINIGRGGLIDERALMLHINKFKGIALDVFEQEPLDVNSPLWDIKNMIITPHNSFVSNLTNQRMYELIKKNLGECK